MRKLKVTELNRLTPEAFKESKKIPLIVVLDHIRSLNNVGSVFRTSDAFRVEAIYLCGITACPPNASCQDMYNRVHPRGCFAESRSSLGRVSFVVMRSLAW